MLFRSKAQQKLDSINHKLSLALDVANIVPWKCDLNNGTILCDINKPVKAASGEAILQNEASLSVSDECYFSKIHKEDRDRIRQAYDDLIAGRKDKVCEEYRVISNESGHWHMEWVEALAAVESFDAQGRPKTLVGTSQVITERKPHIGTDILAGVIKNMRQAMEARGARFCFESCMTDYRREADGKMFVEVNHKEWIETSRLVLAIGHRDRKSVV